MDKSLLDVDCAVTGRSSHFERNFKLSDALLPPYLRAAMTVSTNSRSHSHTPHTIDRFISTYGPSRRRCVEGASGAVLVLDWMGNAWGDQPTGGILKTGKNATGCHCSQESEIATQVKKCPLAGLNNRPHHIHVTSDALYH